MGETAVYKNTTSEMYYPDGDNISTIQLIPGSKRSSRYFACKQRACNAGTVVGFIVLLPAFIALLVMYHQLRTELNLVKADLKHPCQLTASNAETPDSLNEQIQQVNDTISVLSVRTHDISTRLQTDLQVLNASVQTSIDSMSVKIANVDTRLQSRIQDTTQQAQTQLDNLADSVYGNLSAVNSSITRDTLHVINHLNSELGNRIAQVQTNLTNDIHESNRKLNTFATLSYMANYTNQAVDTASNKTQLYCNDMIESRSDAISLQVSAVNNSIWSSANDVVTDLQQALSHTNSTVYSLTSQVQGLREFISKDECNQCADSSPCRTGDLGISVSNMVKSCITGVITTDGYPHANYSHHTDQEWIIANPGFATLDIKLIDFQLEGSNRTGSPSNDCDYDYLLINGIRYCGTVPPNLTMRLHLRNLSQVRMGFVTDGSVTKRGFKLRFTFL